MGSVRPVTNGVIFAPNWLGDAVMCLPAVAALRAAQPQCSWRVLARPAVAPVFRLARPGLEVQELPKPPSLNIPGFGASIAVLFPNSFYAALLALRIGARRRVGYNRDGRGWLLTQPVRPPEAGATPSHESFTYLELLRRGGLIAEYPAAAADLDASLHPDPRGVAAWRQSLGPAPRIALHIGATFGTAKRWLPERFAAVARDWADRGATVILVGSAAERDLAREVRIQARVPTTAPGQIKNIAGETTLEQLVEVLAACQLLVANDSGPMHLAGAVGTPVVAIFGSTNERETYPLAPAGKLHLVKAPGIECSPCKLRECPIDHRCMTRIAVSTVLRATEEALGG